MQKSTTRAVLGSHLDLKCQCCSGPCKRSRRRLGTHAPLTWRIVRHQGPGGEQSIQNNLDPAHVQVENSEDAGTDARRERAWLCVRVRACDVLCVM